MISLIVGADGLLGSHLMLDERLGSRWGTVRKARLGFTEFHLESLDPPNVPVPDIAFLCAGTKGFAECEGNRDAFRADVDGNITLAHRLLRTGTFVVFVSTDAVEWGLHTAYARNRFHVELSLVGHLSAAIFRPKKFDARRVGEVAQLVADIGLERNAGLYREPA